MKKLLFIVISLVVIVGATAVVYVLTRDDAQSVAALTPPPPKDAQTDGPVETRYPSPEISGEFRAVWVSTVLNLDYPSRVGLTADELKAEASSILDDALAMGFGAVILQVRPAADALYKSAIYPWSQYLTGEQGRDPGFDPLQYWIDAAHARGIQLHAWINPYRVARGSHELEALAPGNPARLHPDWVVKHTDGNMYLNPGIPEAARLVVNGVLEVLENYSVDGIHFDDYFYPDGGIDDADTYASAGTALALDDWRRQNVDSLIAEIHNICREYEVPFGVSPFAIWRNVDADPDGSNTNGNQSYSSHYADTRKWVLESMVDYIAPQIYWEIGFARADYAVLLEWWSRLCEGTDVKLYIGHADYRANDPNRSSPWFGTTELLRQLELNRTYANVAGSIHFRYAFFRDDPDLFAFIQAFHFAEPLPVGYPLLPSFENDDGISIGRPYEDARVSFDAYYVLGRCDPETPLYMNGEPVSGVTPGGWFGVYVKLKNGDNVLRFTQGDNEAVRVITRAAAPSAPDTIDTPEIPPDSTYPSASDIYVQSGEKVTLRCTAPIGAEVSATLAGKQYKLSPSTTKKPQGSGIFSTTYSYTYTAGDAPDGMVTTVGAPVYTLTYNGKVTSVTAGGSILILGKNAPFYAVVSVDYAFLYPRASTQGGSNDELPRGFRDYVTAVTQNGTWVRTASGYWLQREQVELVNGTEQLQNQLTQAALSPSEGFEALSIAATEHTLATVSYDDSAGSLTLIIHNAAAAPALSLPAGSMFSSVSQWTDGGTARFRLTLRDASELHGYYLEGSEGEIRLVVKKKPQLKDGVQPLSGLTIYIDPGHGGEDLGAVGPGGYDMSERVLALALSEKIAYELRSLGANIAMSRTEDVYSTVYDRLDEARSLKPDLILSVHLNAMEVNVDASGVVGVSTWYRNPLSLGYADTMVRHVSAVTGIRSRSANQSNLYMCRSNLCPSLILETGFVCSPSDFEWLTDDNRTAAFARATASSILEYLRR